MGWLCVCACVRVCCFLKFLVESDTACICFDGHVAYAEQVVHLIISFCCLFILLLLQ